MQKENHLKAFECYLLEQYHSRATTKLYSNNIKHLLEYINKDIKKINEDDVKVYLTYMKQRLAIFSHRHNIYAIKSWLRWLDIEGKNHTIDYFDKLDASPKTKKLNPLKAPSKTLEEKNRVRKLVTLSEDEIEQFYKASKNNLKEYLMFRLFVITMQRAGSVLNIDDKDIQGDKLIIHAKGNETYPVSIKDEELIKAIEDYKATREEAKEGFVEDNWKHKKYHKDALFLNGRGKRPCQQWINRVFNKYANQLKLTNPDGTPKRIHPQLTRHSTSTILMVKYKINPKVVQQQTGHKSLAVLMNYCHPEEEVSQKTCVDILSGKTSVEETPNPPQPPKKPQNPTDIMVGDTPDIKQLMKQIETLQNQVKDLQKPNHDFSIQ